LLSVRESGAQLRDGTVEAALEHDVDDAGDGVRAVGRRSAVDENIDAFERERGNDRRIDRAAAEGLGHEAQAVDHQERANAGVVVEAADVDARASVDVGAGIRSDRAGAHIGSGDAAEQIRDRERARLGEVLRT
jgi:hypothetical protein